MIFAESDGVVDTVPGDTSTSFALAVGGSVSGYISPESDQDWYQITLTGGTTYTFSLDGSGSSPLNDPYLRLFDGSGAQVAFNDDGGPGLNSRLVYTPASSGTYYLSAGAYQSSSYDNVGQYTLAAAAGGGSAPTYTLEQIADYLQSGYWQDSGGAAHHFATSTITYNVGALTAAGQNLARAALQTWADVTDLTFVETTSSAQITFDDADSGAYSSSSYSGGITSSAFVNVSTSWLNAYGTDTYSYSFQTYIHEIGHALGLGHAGPYNGSASYGVDNIYANDSWAYSVMSYFDQSESGYGSFRLVMTPQLADIVAVQDYYGTPADTRAGDTTYGFNSNAGALYDFTNYGGAPALTIFDSAGVDTLDLSGYNAAQTIDLTPDSFSSVGGYANNLSIAANAIVENAIGGGGSDVLTGNDLSNMLAGGGGNDSLSGGGGNDVLDGGGGSDTAIFSAALSAYSLIAFNGTTAVLTSGADGSDRLVNIENLQFSDQTVAASTAPAFSAYEYIASYGDLIAAFGTNGQAGFDHFVDNGFGEGRTVTFDGLEYIASYADLIAAFGADAEAGASHFLSNGLYEGRSILFSGLEYIASYSDLIAAYGLDAHAGAMDYLTDGLGQGRTVSFDGLEYIASYGDLIAAFGADAQAGTVHYINNGFGEGRTTSFDALAYIASYTDLIGAFGANADAGASHYITSGLGEGRAVTFDARLYLGAYEDVRALFGTDIGAATAHYITTGFGQGRGTDAFDPLEYIASYGDLIAAFGADAQAGLNHFFSNGFAEGRGDSFDGLEYIASYGDLITTLGVDRDAGTADYITSGFGEGRAVTFDPDAYIHAAGNEDLLAAFGADLDAATVHYITNGFDEGRATA